MDDSERADLLRTMREEHATGMAVNDLRIAAPLAIHCRRCDRNIEIPCRSDSEQLADGTWRMTVHLDHDALQTHFDTHTDED